MSIGAPVPARVDAATKAVNIDRVLAIVGPACSGAVLATANSVAIPAGVLMITPSGTSPEITKLKDKDLVYRTLPSDDYQGRALARTLKAVAPLRPSNCGFDVLDRKSVV